MLKVLLLKRVGIASAKQLLRRSSAEAYVEMGAMMI